MNDLLLVLLYNLLPRIQLQHIREKKSPERKNGSGHQAQTNGHSTIFGRVCLLIRHQILYNPTKRRKFVLCSKISPSLSSIRNEVEKT